MKKQKIEDVDAETLRLDESITASIRELEAIQQNAEKELGGDEAAIFNAHILVLKDPELIGPIKEKIRTDKVNAEHALKETTDMFIAMFESMDNEYMRETGSRYS